MSEMMLAQLKEELGMSQLTEIPDVDDRSSSSIAGPFDATAVHRFRRPDVVPLAAENRRARADPVRLVRLDRRGFRQTGGARSAGPRSRRPETARHD